MKMNLRTNAVDLSAKLLATENLSVRRARTRTASFDIKSRVLTIPMWKEMTPEIEGMLVGHEVGHALYTGDEYTVPIRENPKMMSYLNVLEDVRIEKLLKRKYPGIRKTMLEGYRQLNERDFFGVANSHLRTMNLIDRINLYFKAGFSCGVTFTSEEKPFVVRAEKTELIEDVIQLAHDIYGYSMEQARKRIEMMGDEEEIEDEDDENDPDDNYEYEDSDDLDDEDDDGDFDDRTEDEKAEDQNSDIENGKPPSSGPKQNPEEKKQEQIDKELESITDKTLEENLAQLADDSTEYMYHTLDSRFMIDPIVPYKTILSDVAENYARCELPVKPIDSFNSDASRIVSYLNKEFEMKKSATMYKRATTSKIGSLDMKKVWSYKLNNDLFKRVTSFPQGKNHGMVMLVDWSGSMDMSLEDTVKQFITLAMFCRRAQIPYRVFLFSSQYDIGLTTMDMREKMNLRYRELADTSTLNNCMTNMALLEVFHDKMTNMEFNNMCKYLIDINMFRHSKHGEYHTGGTPLNEALSYMVEFIPKFKKQYNIEKMSFITLTDGEGGALYPTANYGMDDTRREDCSTPEAPYASRRINVKHFLQDPITKKAYPIQRNGSVQTNAILQMIKDRYQVNTVGFYIVPNTRRYLSSAVRSNLPLFTGSDYAMIEEWRKEFRANGFASVKNAGRDDLFIIPQNRMTIADEELEIAQKQTAKQIAKTFTKHMTGKKTSRVLLNQFIGIVA